MRRSFPFLFFLLSCAAAILALSVPSRQAKASDLSYARIVRVSLVNGDVQISRPGHPAWEPAAQNMPVTQGVTIGTNDGYAEIEFEDGTTAWISQNTLVQFTELALASGGRVTKLTLAQGTMSILTALRRGDSFTLATGGETIDVPKSSLFRVDCFHDGASVSVFAGEVQLSLAAGTKTVPKGQTIAYKTKHAEVAQNANPKPDNWDRWVVERARASESQTAEAVSYVNAPFSYGLGDMSAYGSWNYFAGYGYGWQPYGTGSCWMPFMNGQWDFYSGLGWTWVSAEPWGWMPYHFGSWNYLPSAGWTWFPSGFDLWDPAPVNWYAAGNQVGWWPASAAAPSELMFEGVTRGCPGFGGMPSGAFGGYAARGRRTVAQKGRGGSAGGKPPAPPRLVLTTNRLGHGDRISLGAFNASASKEAVPAREPLENGKTNAIAGAASGGASERSAKMLVPTTRDIARLQRSLATAGSSLATMRLNASTQMRTDLRAVNAMPMPALPSHRPPAMTFSQANMVRESVVRGTSSSSFNGRAPSMSSAPARAPSAPASGGGGKPH